MQNDAYAPALPTIVRVTSSHSASEKGRCNKLCYAIHEFHETCPSLTFYFMKISFSDIDRKWILPNMIRTGTALIIFGKIHFLLILENESFMK